MIAYNLVLSGTLMGFNISRNDLIIIIAAFLISSLFVIAAYRYDRVLIKVPYMEGKDDIAITLGMVVTTLWFIPMCIVILHYRGEYIQSIDNLKYNTANIPIAYKVSDVKI